MRPMPAGSSNIGTWLLILDVITFCSIFSNSGNIYIFLIILYIYLFI